MTSLLWSFAAWCALALAIERHHETVFPRASAAAARRRWCAAGCAGMVAALAAAVVSQGWALGLLSAVGSAVVGGGAAAVLLAWRPRHCLHAAAGALLIGAALA